MDVRPFATDNQQYTYPWAQSSGSCWRRKKATARVYSNGSETTFQVLERESGLLDWRTKDGTRFLVTLSNDVPAQNSRVRLRLGDALDWTASCPYLEVRVYTRACVRVAVVLRMSQKFGSTQSLVLLLASFSGAHWLCLDTK